MNHFSKRIIFTAVLIIFTCSSVMANQNLEALSESQRKFVEQYVQAINANEVMKLKGLMHLHYLDCIDSSNQDYYDGIFQKLLAYDIPSDYVISIEPLLEENIKKEMEAVKQWGLPYPVQPTHQLQIDFDKNKYSSVTIVRKLVQEETNYYEVGGCPSQEMVVKFREMKQKKEEAKIRAKELYQKIDKPLQNELTQLLKDGRKIDAWKKYSEVTGESLATAKEVLSHINIE